MHTIETTAVVTPERTVTVQLPADVPPGPCGVVVVVEPANPQPPAARPRFTEGWPAHDVGPWPEGFTASREQLYGDDGR
jgi:hypothetical protein